MPPERKAPESRTVDVDVAELGNTGRTVTGYAAVYGRESRDLGGFRERIAPGAFDAVLAGDADVRCLLNHDANIVLGRTASGTLRLRSEERGLRFECDLPESRSDLAESIGRGDLDGASFRFEVARDSWSGDLRTVEEIRSLHDVSLASYPAYPGSSIELRTDPAAGSSSSSSSDDDRGLRVRDRRSVRAGESRAGRGLFAELRSAGFPGERATIPFLNAEGRAVTLAAGDTVDELNVQQMTGFPLGYDSRFAFPAFPTVAVDEGVTSVNVTRQSARSLATAANVVRAIDAVTAKPETGSELSIAPTALKQVATKQSGIPNVYLESELVASIVETDLRLAINGGLDKLVLDAIAGAGFQAPGTDKLLVSIRKAMTTIQAAGYNPDTVLLRPADAETLDTTVSASGTEDYIFGPGTPAGGIWNLTKRVSKTVPAPVVLDSQAVGKLYASPISLATFEESAGATNTSLVRLELHALFGVERIGAAVRIAAS